MGPYVSYCDNKVKLREVRGDYVQTIIKLGGIETEEAGVFEIPLPEESEKPKLFSALRDMGIAFSSGREWSPAEQFEDLRDKGLVSGEYACLVWRGPDNASAMKK
jgi:hypothetical protein